MQHVFVTHYGVSVFLRVFVTLCAGWTFTHSFACCAFAANRIAEGETIWITTIHLEGLLHTKPETVERLLPRPVPAEFSQVEVDEFERRVRNLSLFDHVQVRREDEILTVTVQEKITLAPILSFTSGSSLKDLNATVGLVEYNLWGTGTQLGGQFNYSQRGPNVELWLSQHAFEPHRWAKEIKGSYNVNGIRFADSTASWNRNRIGTELELKGPYRYGSPLRYEVVVKFYRELVERETGPNQPPNGYYVGIIPELTWDQYHWHDLVPRGYRIVLELRPGYFFGPNQQRHEAELRYLQGIPLGSSTVFMINGVAEAVNVTDNPNHSLLIGSITGVRGLSDNLYRTRAQSYANLELRHAVRLAPRWAVQGVLFSDVGTFQPFASTGRPEDWQTAVNTGVGVRIIPTFLSNTLFRLDLAQLWRPEPNSLVQIGITQYF
ncbi:MAG: hypothetical protein P0111_03030 [Nitrospira sp.]|nr:hypothetical protein [Nitrospira sp.]